MIKKGQALVEFALVLTVFLILALGMIDWGIYLFANSVIDSATRDATRTAIIFTDWSTNYDARTTQLKTLITNQTQTLPTNIKTNIDSKVYITFDPNINAPVSITVEVRAQPFTPISGFLGALVPQTISAKSTMHYETH